MKRILTFALIFAGVFSFFGCGGGGGGGGGGGNPAASTDFFTISGNVVMPATQSATATAAIKGAVNFTGMKARLTNTVGTEVVPAVTVDETGGYTFQKVPPGTNYRITVFSAANKSLLQCHIDMLSTDQPSLTINSITTAIAILITESNNQKNVGQIQTAINNGSLDISPVSNAVETWLSGAGLVAGEDVSPGVVVIVGPAKIQGIISKIPDPISGGETPIPTPTSAPTPTPPTTATSNKRYALIMGINQSLIAEPLNGCVSDAVSFWGSLVRDTNTWSPESIALLLDEDATKAGIRNGLKELASLAKPGDLVVYYQSSHGGAKKNPKDAVLVSFDSEYSDTEMASDLAQFQTGVKIVIVLDACHSAGMFKSVRNGAPNTAIKLFSPNQTAQFAQNVMEKIRKSSSSNKSNGAIRQQVGAVGPEIGWLTASDYSESAIETGDWYFTSKPPTTGGSGAFTKHLVRGFSNGDRNLDGNVSFKELFDYAFSGMNHENQVKKMYFGKELPQQTPQMLNELLLQEVIVAKTSTKDNFEPDNTPYDASKITMGEETPPHSLDPLGDEDWFRFSVVSATKVVIDAYGEGNGRARLELFSVDAPGKANIGTPFDCGILPPGDYYLRISNDRFNEKFPAAIIPSYQIRVSTY